jgi:Flp pilus assembly protein TadG
MLAALRHRLADDRGTTLIELLVVIPGLLTVAGAAMALSGIFAHEERTTASRTSVVEAQRIASERITREIRQASAATVLGGGSGLRLSTYVFQNRVKTPATVTYDCSTGTCTRAVAPATAGTPLIAGVRNPSSVFAMPTAATVTLTLQVDVPHQSSDATVVDGAQLVNR